MNILEKWMGAVVSRKEKKLRKGAKLIRGLSIELCDFRGIRMILFSIV